MASTRTSPPTSTSGTHIQKLFNRSSPMKLVRLGKKMNYNQRKLISDSGFPGLLDIKCSKLDPKLCKFLMDSFNPHSCQLEFGERGCIPVTEESVHRVLGVPMGPSPVLYHKDAAASSLFKSFFQNMEGKSPKLSKVGKMLETTKLAPARYLKLWVLYTVCSIIAPTTSTRISSKCYPSLMKAAMIGQLNWCRFVIDILIQAALARKNMFNACMPFIMILYIDSLETQDIRVREKGTRICVWTNKMVNAAVTQDTRADDSFGMLPLKKCFRKQNNISLSDPDKIEQFISANVPGNCGQLEMSKYRKAVSKMIRRNDRVVREFLREASGIDAPDQSSLQHHPISMAPRPTHASRSTSKMPQNAISPADSDEDTETSDDDYQGANQEHDFQIPRDQKAHPKPCFCSKQTQVGKDWSGNVNDATAYRKCTHTQTRKRTRVGRDQQGDRISCHVQTPPDQLRQTNEETHTQMEKLTTGNRRIISHPPADTSEMHITREAAEPRNDISGSRSTETRKRKVKNCMTIKENKSPTAVLIPKEATESHAARSRRSTTSEISAHIRKSKQPHNIPQRESTQAENREALLFTHAHTPVIISKTPLATNSTVADQGNLIEVSSKETIGLPTPNESPDHLRMNETDSQSSIGIARDEQAQGGLLSGTSQNAAELAKRSMATKQLMFPVLQDLTPTETHTGHFYLINLNLKETRFEVMDSLRNKGKKSMTEDADKIIASIKYLWKKYCNQSEVKIDYDTFYVTVPKQHTTCDCGYFMLKFIECWDGQKMLNFDGNGISNIRKLYTKKWIDCVGNKAPWRKLLGF